jgi:hypothetical protein
MNSKLVKGLLLIAGVFFTALQNPPVVWAITIITAILIGGSYFVKNYLSPSVSPSGTLSWQDILSAVLLAIFAAVSNSLTSLVVNGVIIWSLLGKTVISVIITYITTTYFSGDVQPPPLKSDGSKV